MHAFSPSIWEAESGRVQGQPGLYRLSSKTVRAIQENPVSKSQKKKKLARSTLFIIKIRILKTKMFY